MAFRDDAGAPTSHDGYPILDPDDLSIDYSPPTAERSWLVIAVAGEVHAANARQLEDAVDLPASRHPRIALDLHAVPLCDSEGIITLLKIRSRARSADQEVRFVNLSDQVRKVFEMSGVAEILADEL